MKKLLFLMAMMLSFSVLNSCSKDGEGDGGNDLTGQWSYYWDEDIYNWEMDSYDFMEGGVFKVHYYGKSWDGNVEHAIGRKDYYYVGTYSLSGNTLTLKAQYYIEGTEEETSSKTLTFNINTLPVTSSTESITVYNNQESRTEVWDRDSDD